VTVIHRACGFDERTVAGAHLGRVALAHRAGDCVRDGSRTAETARGFGSRQPGPAPSREDADLDIGRYCSLYVLMPIETLKDALSAGWRVHARCIDGQVDNTVSAVFRPRL